MCPDGSCAMSLPCDLIKVLQVSGPSFLHLEVKCQWALKVSFSSYSINLIYFQTVPSCLICPLLGIACNTELINLHKVLPLPYPL